MATRRSSFRIPEVELQRLGEISERFPSATAALLFCINHTWATTTSDDARWLTFPPMPAPSDYQQVDSYVDPLSGETVHRSALWKGAFTGVCECGARLLHEVPHACQFTVDSTEPHPPQ